MQSTPQLPPHARTYDRGFVPKVSGALGHVVQQVRVRDGSGNARNGAAELFGDVRFLREQSSAHVDGAKASRR